MDRTAKIREVFASALPPAHRHVLTVALLLEGPTGTGTASWSAVGRATGLSERTIRRVVQDLRDYSILEESESGWTVAGERIRSALDVPAISDPEDDAKIEPLRKARPEVDAIDLVWERFRGLPGQERRMAKASKAARTSIRARLREDRERGATLEEATDRVLLVLEAAHLSEAFRFYRGANREGRSWLEPETLLKTAGWDGRVQAAQAWAAAGKPADTWTPGTPVPASSSAPAQDPSKAAYQTWDWLLGRARAGATSIDPELARLRAKDPAKADRLEAALATLNGFDGLRGASERQLPTLRGSFVGALVGSPMTEAAANG
jgi:hypothetical protein